MIENFNSKGYIFENAWFFILAEIKFWLDCFHDDTIADRVRNDEPIPNDQIVLWAVDLFIIKVLVDIND